MGNDIKEMKLKVEGITCTSCAMEMENTLRDIEGILNASVNLTEDTMNIRYDSALINRKQLFINVRKLVHKAEIVSESRA